MKTSDHTPLDVAIVLIAIGVRASRLRARVYAAVPRRRRAEEGPGWAG
jgi:hypothetical protein